MKENIETTIIINKEDLMVMVDITTIEVINLVDEEENLNVIYVLIKII